MGVSWRALAQRRRYVILPAIVAALLLAAAFSQAAGSFSLTLNRGSYSEKNVIYAFITGPPKESVEVLLIDGRGKTVETDDVLLSSRGNGYGTITLPDSSAYTVRVRYNGQTVAEASVNSPQDGNTCPSCSQRTTTTVVATTTTQTAYVPTNEYRPPASSTAATAVNPASSTVITPETTTLSSTVATSNPETTLQESTTSTPTYSENETNPDALIQKNQGTSTVDLAYIPPNEAARFAQEDKADHKPVKENDWKKSGNVSLYRFSGGEFTRKQSDAVYPGSDSFSVEAWIKADESRDSVIVSSGECCGIDSYWKIVQSRVTDNLSVLTVVVNNGSGELSAYGNVNIADGLWHQVVLVRDTGNIEVRGYVDSVLDLNMSDTFGVILDNSSFLYVGVGNPFQNEGFNGTIANVKTYRRALGDDEIKSLYSEQISEVSGVTE
ncbi:Concanavalin A-like lectin/glucanases superfamily protein [uncultured archaeon]|nr:Concanavalin A-like lectin/glucanases superfamily protein [uncultured archaeon]